MTAVETRGGVSEDQHADHASLGERALAKVPKLGAHYRYDDRSVETKEEGDTLRLVADKRRGAGGQLLDDSSDEELGDGMCGRRKKSGSGSVCGGGVGDGWPSAHV